MRHPAAGSGQGRWPYPDRMRSALDAVLSRVPEEAREDAAGIVALTPDDRDIDIDVIVPAESRSDHWVVAYASTLTGSAVHAKLLKWFKAESASADRSPSARLFVSYLLTALGSDWESGRADDPGYLVVDPAVFRSASQRWHHHADYPSDLSELTDLIRTQLRVGSDFATLQRDPPGTLRLPSFDWEPTTALRWHFQFDLHQHAAGETSLLDRMREPLTREEARSLGARINAPDAASRKLPPRP